ncbi:MAG TPA: TonB-dependent receptor, partial [Thermoanaerobaculia bacterium]|nr:TonB-dependent receptor [Thermoanaerobaculia bacterium]
MQGKGKHSRSKTRKHAGKPPRWLVFSALAASATAQAAAAPEPFRWMRHDTLAQVLPARRGDDAQDGAALTRDPRPAVAAESPAPGLTVHRFEIPAGPLGTVLAAFEKAAGIDVQVEEQRLRSLPSPGVHGLYTVEQALQELLAGTEITYRFDGPRKVRLDLGIADSIDVTATPGPASPKYTAPLLDTPQTLTVIPQRLIQEQGASTLRDVLRNVTGISIQAGEGGGGLPGDNLSIRGFASRNDIFVDGVRDFGAYSRDPFNIEQIEVAKGPSSLYGGRGTTGGSLNLTSKKPHLEAAQFATAGAGDAEFGRATIDLNQPLGDNLPGAALRVNGMWTHSDVSGRDAVQSERWGIAPSLAFGLGTPTRWTLSYSHLAQDNVPDYGLPWVPPTNVPLARYADKPAPVSFSNFYGLTGRDYEKTVTGLSTAEVEHDFAWGQGSEDQSLSLRSILRHGRSTRDSIITAPRFVSTDSTDINRQIQSRDLEDTILTQQNNLTARFLTGPFAHAVVTGVEAARETSENFARSGPNAPVANLFNPNPDTPYTGPITRTGARTESTADTAALYASDTLRINDRWQATGGLRWDHFN